MEAYNLAFQLNKLGMVEFITLLSCFPDMVIPDFSLVAIFESVFITTFASVGINSLLAAAMLPCICIVMRGVSPPLSLGLYAGMSLAESEFGKMFKNNLRWVAMQFIMKIIIPMGWLYIMGLKS